MTTLLLGAIIAFVTTGIVLWLADKRSLITTRYPSASDADATPKLLSMLQARGHEVFAAIMIALAVTAFAGEIMTPSAETPASVATASAANGDIRNAYDKLKAFAATEEAPPAAPSLSPTSASAQTSTTGLADVETMIAKLEERLTKDPKDAAGWRMLGWSYQNTGRPAEALAAYDRGLAIDPENTELKTARASVGVASADSASGPTTEQVVAASAMPDADRQAMIQGMVDGLAARLATSPHDEEGWSKLIRSRVVLGDPGKAAEDLASARQAFAGDTAILDRLSSLGRKLGLEPR